MSDSLAILPRSMGQPKPQPKKTDARKFMPQERGGLLVENPQEEKCPYTFSDSPAYTRMKKAEQDAKRAAELEGKDELRGFIRSIDELCRMQKWDEALQVLERRTAVSSGLFLVARALLRWKSSRFGEALRDAEDAMRTSGGAGKSGPLAAAFASFARICLGSEARDRATCSRDLLPKVAAWEAAEQSALRNHALGQGLFQPRQAERLSEPFRVPGAECMEAHDGSYVAASGIRIGYVLLKNHEDLHAPVVLHFHGSDEISADYRQIGALASRYSQLPAHVMIVDYRGYGWSSGEPSLATCLRDAEPLAEKLGEIFIGHGLVWPYPGGLVLSGRSLGAHVAVHLAALFPGLFRSLVLDSAAATSASGDRLGRGAERAEALDGWRKQLEQANLDALQPLASELCCLSDLEKVHAYDGSLLVIHGAADEVVPVEVSESLHSSARTRQKELVLIDEAGHDNICEFDAYWSALRRFCLKAQLDDTFPSISGQVEHLCAVCAEKASSKCGRCQKVWYCGRKHQAEHWKVHKTGCAGGPPEPKASAGPVEADACLIAAVAMHVSSVEDTAALEQCLKSMALQSGKALRSVYVGWSAASTELEVKVREQLDNFKSHCKSCDSAADFRAFQSTRRRSRFEHLHSTLAECISHTPAHSWVVLPEMPSSGEIWSPNRAAVLLPALRRAAADARVVGVRCGRHARPTQDLPAHEWPGDAATVEQALSAGVLTSADRAHQCLSDIVVRSKALRNFLDSESPAVLAHELCDYRFIHKLTHMFGKKVQDFCPSDDEWMLWTRPPGEQPYSTQPEGIDTRWGTPLWELVRDNGWQAAQNTAPAVTPSYRLSSELDAEMAVRRLRLAIERTVIKSAGDRIDPKDLKDNSMDHVRELLEECGLGAAVGLQRWAREVAADVSQRAAHLFGVTVGDT